MKYLLLITIWEVYRTPEGVLIHHTELFKLKQRTTKINTSQRENLTRYYLTRDKQKVLVCTTLFINTLEISDCTVKTALKKLSTVGTIEGDKLGGRQFDKISSLIHCIDQIAIENLINRFP